MDDRLDVNSGNMTRGLVSTVQRLAAFAQPSSRVRVTRTLVYEGIAEWVAHTLGARGSLIRGEGDVFNPQSGLTITCTSETIDLLDQMPASLATLPCTFCGGDDDRTYCPKSPSGKHTTNNLTPE